jgi:hypothetical protein
MKKLLVFAVNSRTWREEGEEWVYVSRRRRMWVVSSRASEWGHGSRLEDWRFGERVKDWGCGGGGGGRGGIVE